VPVCNSRTKPSSLDLVLVDDDQMIHDIVVSFIRNKSLASRFFLYVDSALSHLCGLSAMPRILIVDFIMPRVTGVEFLSELSRTMNLSDSDVFLCSSTTPQRESVDKALQLGASIIDKSLICNRDSLNGLLEYKSGAT